MSLFDRAAFNRGKQWADRRRELKAQRKMDRAHLARTEGYIAGCLARRNRGEDVDDALIARHMTDWLLIHEEVDGQ